MYRLMIVDDEKTTRESLRDTIAGSQLGISHITTAKNGIEALELARTSQPDILLTDIRMPKMDGLELARQLREQYPECKIIFLTGYADKAYLKTAIHLKALSYIEKPINPAEITAALRETVNLCEAELQQKQTLTQMQQHLNDRIPLIRQEITVELVNGNTDYTKLTAQFGAQCPALPTDGRYTVAYLTVDWHSQLETLTVNHHKYLILTTVTTGVTTAPPNWLAGFDPVGNLILIHQAPPDQALPEIKPLLTALLTELDQITDHNGRFAVGIGGVAVGLSQIPQSYRTAVAASTLQFYCDTQRIFEPGALSASQSVTVDKGLFTSFKKALQTDQFASAEKLLNDLTEQIKLHRDQDLNRVKNIYFHLLLAVYEVALARGLIEPFHERETTYIWKEVSAKPSLAELSAYVLSSIKTLDTQLAETAAVSRKVGEITRFIQLNYADKTLSIPSIAAHVYLSPTYLCAFFKKTTGKTLNELITETRIAKAKELLQAEQVKLYEIATQVGFSDVNYFSTLFKRRVGCTPSEFREKYYR